MIKQTVQKKNSIISLENTKDKALSIQFSLDGFSFCVSNVLTKKDIFFNKYQFEVTLKTPEDLLEKIKDIFNKDTNLQLDYSNVSIIHKNNLATLVPNTYFDKNSLAKYLDFNIKTLKNDYITFDDVLSIDAKNVYIPYVNINNYLFQNFGEFEFKHHYTKLLEKFLDIHNSDQKIMYVNVSINTFDIIVLEKNKLVFINTFSFTSKEDFIYYILFTAEQLQLNTEIFKLFFTGEINVKSELYKITFNYINNVSFLESKNQIFKDLKIDKHSNFILLG